MSVSLCISINTHFANLPPSMGRLLHMRCNPRVKSSKGMERLVPSILISQEERQTKRDIWDRDHFSCEAAPGMTEVGESV